MADSPSSDNGLTRFFTGVWPLLALFVTCAVTIRACVPSQEGIAPSAAAPSAVAAYDSAPVPAANAANNNSLTMAALGALTPDSEIADVLAALNRVTIAFAPTSAAVPDGADALLVQAAGVLQTRPQSERFEIAAYADDAGSPLSDLELARRRAQAVIDFLVNQGVPAQRLQGRGVADEDPAAREPGQLSGPRTQRIQFTLLP